MSHNSEREFFRAGFAKCILRSIAPVLLITVPILTSRSADSGAATPIPADNARSWVTPVNAAEAAAHLQKRNVTVLDIRTPEEFAQGRIAGATNINFMAKDFAERLAGLDRSKTYLVHCASGNRSTRSLPVLQKLGFESVLHLEGGLKAWRSADLPVGQ